MHACPAGPSPSGLLLRLRRALSPIPSLSILATCYPRYPKAAGDSKGQLENQALTEES